MRATKIPRQATPTPTEATTIPALSPAERPDEEDGVGEEGELESELEPAGEEELAWPTKVEAAVEADLVS